MGINREWAEEQGYNEPSPEEQAYEARKKDQALRAKYPERYDTSWHSKKPGRTEAFNEGFRGRDNVEPY